MPKNPLSQEKQLALEKQVALGRDLLRFLMADRIDIVALNKFLEENKALFLNVPFTPLLIAIGLKDPEEATKAVYALLTECNQKDCWAKQKDDTNLNALFQAISSENYAAAIHLIRQMPLEDRYPYLINAGNHVKRSEFITNIFFEQDSLTEDKQQCCQVMIETYLCDDNNHNSYWLPRLRSNPIAAKATAAAILCSGQWSEAKVGANGPKRDFKYDLITLALQESGLSEADTTQICTAFKKGRMADGLLAAEKHSQEYPELCLILGHIYSECANIIKPHNIPKASRYYINAYNLIQQAPKTDILRKKIVQEFVVKRLVALLLQLDGKDDVELIQKIKNVLANWYLNTQPQLNDDKKDSAAGAAAAATAIPNDVHIKRAREYYERSAHYYLARADKAANTPATFAEAINDYLLAARSEILPDLIGVIRALEHLIEKARTLRQEIPREGICKWIQTYAKENAAHWPALEKILFYFAEMKNDSAMDALATCYRAGREVPWYLEKEVLLTALETHNLGKISLEPPKTKKDLKLEEKLAPGRTLQELLKKADQPERKAELEAFLKKNGGPFLTEYTRWRLPMENGYCQTNTPDGEMGAPQGWHFHEKNTKSTATQHYYDYYQYCQFSPLVIAACMEDPKQAEAAVHLLLTCEQKDSYGLTAHRRNINALFHCIRVGNYAAATALILQQPADKRYDYLRCAGLREGEPQLSSDTFFEKDTESEEKQKCCIAMLESYLYHSDAQKDGYWLEKLRKNRIAAQLIATEILCNERWSEANEGSNNPRHDFKYGVIQVAINAHLGANKADEMCDAFKSGDLPHGIAAAERLAQKASVEASLMLGHLYSACPNRCNQDIPSACRHYIRAFELLSTVYAVPNRLAICTRIKLFIVKQLVRLKQDLDAEEHSKLVNTINDILALWYQKTYKPETSFVKYQEAQTAPSAPLPADSTATTAAAGATDEHVAAAEACYNRSPNYYLALATESDKTATDAAKSRSAKLYLSAAQALTVPQEKEDSKLAEQLTTTITKLLDALKSNTLVLTNPNIVEDVCHWIHEYAVKTPKNWEALRLILIQFIGANAELTQNTAYARYVLAKCYIAGRAAPINDSEAERTRLARLLLTEAAKNKQHEELAGSALRSLPSKKSEWSFTAAFFSSGGGAPASAPSKSRDAAAGGGGSSCLSEDFVLLPKAQPAETPESLVAEAEKLEKRAKSLRERAKEMKSQASTTDAPPPYPGAGAGASNA